MKLFGKARELAGGAGAKPRLKPLALLACLALPLLAGCGTLANTFEEETRNKVYAGVRADFGEWTFAHGGFLDLPFSFVLDTVLLPYTIPKTIANYAAGDKPRPGPDDGDTGGDPG